MSDKMSGATHPLALTGARNWAKQAARAVLMAALAVQGIGPVAQSAAEEGAIKVYRVEKSVSDFPAKDDFSSPEAAYATFNRHFAAGGVDWRALSHRAANEQHPPGALDKPLQISKEAAAGLRNARILQVRIHDGTFAQVVARRPPKARRFETRSFELEDGRWLNAGSTDVATEEEAAKHFQKLVKRRRHAKKSRRASPADAQAVLKECVEYLQKSGVPPKEFVLDAIDRHKLVVIGEIHHRPLYWALNSQVVRDPRFAAAAGTVYMELPAHAQHLVDEFLAADRLDTQPVVEMLRDMMWKGWPDQAMLDFFVAVWQTNQGLDRDQRIRIVLVDMARPYKEWVRNKRIPPGGVDRDKLMAENILSDMKRSGDKRHALVIVGYMHMATLTRVADGSPRKRAGWYLRQALGQEMFSMVQHGPVINNMGKVFGRTCLGLFDEAFAAMDNKPIAFALAQGPFGAQWFDADGEMRALTSSLYRDAFDGYIYLGPLENERFSPLIPGFYTDEFVAELDRRQRLMSGKGLVEAFKLPACDGRSFEAWLGGSWGQRRAWWQLVGPVSVWRRGDGWEGVVQDKQRRLAGENPELIQAEAEQIFNAIRTADYQYPRGLFELHYVGTGSRLEWANWVCSRFKKDPIQSVDLGQVGADKQGRPTVPYVLTLADGSLMQGVLTFDYHARAEVWYGCSGLDWHLPSETEEK